MIDKWAAACVCALTLSFVSVAVAQPETKLTSRLDKGLVQAIWCSSVYFEHAYSFGEGSADALDFEQRAFELGDEIDVRLDEAGMGAAEIDEVWAIYDATSFELAMSDPVRFAEQVSFCDASEGALL